MSQHFIPNSFQHPNALVDELSFFLTPEEEKVLNKALREILGWHSRIESRKAPISLSVFVEGKFDADGRRLCRGCGLSQTAVRSALESLDRYRILVKVGEPTKAGQEYWVQDDFNRIDWPGLEARRAQQVEAGRRRTQFALVKKATKRPITPPAPEPAPAPAPELAAGADPVALLLSAFCDTFGLPLPENRIKADNWLADLEEIYRMVGSLEEAKALLVETLKNLPERYTIVGPASIIEPSRVTLGQIKRQQKGATHDRIDNKQQVAQQQLTTW